MNKPETDMTVIDANVPEAFYSMKLETKEQNECAARIDMYALFADTFRYPDPLFREFIRKGEFREILLALCEKLPFTMDLTEEETNRLTFTDALSDEDVEVEYIRLFDAGPGDPPCPLIEGFHVGDEEGRRSVFKELILFYNNFGLSYAEGSSEDRPDHITYELEFLHYIAFLYLKALQEERETHDFLLAQKDFLERHPSRWVGKMAARMDEISAGLKEDVNREVVEFYRNIVKLLERFVARDFTYTKLISGN
jgi:DMSO reductase family type II enzyme chaperone